MHVESHKYTGTSGVYVSAIPSDKSVEAIFDLIHEVSPMHTHLPIEMLSEFIYEAHMTIMYSRNQTIDVDAFKVDDEILALAHEFDYWSGHDGDGYIVLKVKSAPASKLHDSILEQGAEHSSYLLK